MVVPRIALMMAMAAESAPVVKALAAAEEAPPAWARGLPVRLRRQPDHGGVDVMVVDHGVDPVTGVDCIGTQAAALATHVAIVAHRPDLVLSVGTAGGWARAGAEIGDVYLAWDRFVYHDRRIAIPGFDAFAMGDHPAADLRGPALEVGCRLGVVTTGDSLDESDDDRRRILASGAEVKDMEGAAVAWVARLHSTPVSALKAVTDLVDSPVATESQFAANFDLAVERLGAVVLDLVPRLRSIDLTAGTAP